MSVRDQNLSKLRESIVDVMYGSYEWMTAGNIYSLLRSFKKIKNDITLEHIGNNLRILKNMGIVADTKINSRNSWKLTGIPYDVRPPVKMVVSIPVDIHDKISKISIDKGITKSSLIISMLQDGL